jgi:hypothetical protein
MFDCRHNSEGYDHGDLPDERITFCQWKNSSI